MNEEAVVKLNIAPTSQEVSWRDDEIIVSKTDLTGRITYVNRTFMRVANFSEDQVLGKQHNIVRHPDMPRGAFKLLWDTLKQGREFFGYVKNITSEGHYYWVFANVTPDVDYRGQPVGYYSVRRKASPHGIQVVEGLYRDMLRLEREVGPANAPAASVRLLEDKMKELATTYNKFVLSL